MLRVDRHNLGAAIFLIMLFIAPEMPIGSAAAGPTRQTLSMAAFGLACWLLLSCTRISTLISSRTMPLLLFSAFATYSFVISMLSLKLGSVLFATQYLYYTILLSLIAPAYALHRLRQDRLNEVFKIFACVSFVYIIGILFSVWYGPIYPDQVGTAAKRYDDLVISRAAGFSSGVNQAGGVAAVMAAFYIFIFRKQSNWGLLLSVCAVASIFATLSRSAMISFALALLVWSILVCARALTRMWILRRSVGSLLSLAAVVSLSLCISVGYILIDMHAADTLGRIFNRLGADPAVAQGDVGQRLTHWRRGVMLWLEKPLHSMLFGTGFRTSSIVSARSGAYVSSHNSYIEVVNDFGLIGFLLLFSSIALSLGRLAACIVSRYDNGIINFCFVAMLTIVLHCMTEAFLYSIVIQSILIWTMALSAAAMPFQRKIKTRAQEEEVHGMRLALG